MKTGRVPSEGPERKAQHPSHSGGGEHNFPDVLGVGLFEKEKLCVLSSQHSQQQGLAVGGPGWATNSVNTTTIIVSACLYTNCPVH